MALGLEGNVHMEKRNYDSVGNALGYTSKTLYHLFVGVLVVLM